MTDPHTPPQPQADRRRFALQRIYLKDVSFESPASPRVFTQAWQPQMHLEVDTRATRLLDSHYEVVLTLTLTAQQERQTVLLIEIQQAGLFVIAGIEEPALSHGLHVTCPTILFPYLRETVDSLARKGGLPSVLLAPIDFGRLHQERLEQPPEPPAEEPLP